MTVSSKWVKSRPVDMGFGKPKAPKSKSIAKPKPIVKSKPAKKKIKAYGEVAISSPSKSDAEWRAENDARILMDAQIILLEKGRLQKAKKAAKRMAEEKAKEAEAIRSVAK